MMMMRDAVTMRRAVVIGSAGTPMLGRMQVLPHQRAASVVPHDLLIAHPVALADRALREMAGMVSAMHSVAVRGGVVMRLRVPMRGGMTMRPGVVVRPGAVMVVEARGRRRNERRRKLGAGLRCWRRRRGRHALIGQGL